MTRQLTIDDADSFTIAATVLNMDGSLWVRQINGPWEIGFGGGGHPCTVSDGAWTDQPRDPDRFPTAQAALDAAVEAGAEIQ